MNCHSNDQFAREKRIKTKKDDLLIMFNKQEIRQNNTNKHGNEVCRLEVGTNLRKNMSNSDIKESARRESKSNRKNNTTDLSTQLDEESSKEGSQRSSGREDEDVEESYRMRRESGFIHFL